VHADVQRELAAFEEKEAARKPGYQKKPVTTESLGGELASYHVGFLMHAQAARVVEELDRLWKQPGDKVARDPWMLNIYYQASALQDLGRVDWTAHGDSPTSMVYRHSSGKGRTLVAWNPTEAPRSVRFYEGTRVIGSLTVPPRSLASAKTN
jgi:hypothetical protein